MQFCALHLPAFTDDDLDAGVDQARRGAELAAAIGCSVVIVKGKTRPAYIAGAVRLLPLIDSLPVTPVLTNHAGTAISTLDDYAEVLEGIGDPRIRCLLEVGHFHSVGISWEQAYGFLEGRIAHVHIKDQVGRQSVPFGKGEIDLPGLFARLRQDGYEGDCVVEMEVADKKNTLDYLAAALQYVRENTP
jgi:sugar phosphate isomerase/epimerase